MDTQKRTKRPCKVTAADEEAVRRTAADHGIALRVNVKARHWMFDTVSTGRRIANYWPGTGTVTAGGFRGLAESPWHVVEMAVDLLDGKAPEDVLTGKPDAPIAAVESPANVGTVPGSDLGAAVALLGKLVAAVDRLASVIERQGDVRLSA